MLKSRMVLWCLAAAVLLAGAGTVQAQGTVLDKVPQKADLVVVVKDLAAADAKLTLLLNQLIPHPAGQEPAYLRMLLSKMNGGDLQAFQPNTPFVLVANFQKMIAKEAPEPTMALLAAVTDFKTFVGDSAPDANGVYKLAAAGEMKYAAQHQGLVLMGKTAGDLAFFMKSPVGLKLSAKDRAIFDSSEACMVVNVAKLISAAAPAYEEAHAELVKKLEEAKAEAAKPKVEAETAPAPAATVKVEMAAGGNKVSESQMQLVLMETLWSYARELDGAVLGLAVGQEGADLQFSASVKAGGKLANYMADHKPIGAALEPALPDLGAWMAYWYSMNPDKCALAIDDLMAVVDAVLKVAKNDLKPADQEKLLPPIQQLMAQVKELMPQMGGQGGALLLSNPGQGLMQSLEIIKVKDAQAVRKSVEQIIKSYVELLKVTMEMEAQPAQAEELKKSDFGFTYQRDAQKVGDLSVDKLVFKMPPMSMMGPTNGGGPDPAAIMKAIFGGDGGQFTVWLAYLDGYVLEEVGPAPAHLADLAKSLKAGAADNRAMADYEALRKHALKDSNLISAISLPTYANLIMTFMAAAMNQPMEMPMAQMKPASVMSLAAGDNRLAFKLFVPVAEMQQLKMVGTNAVMMFRMLQMNSQRIQPPGEEPNQAPPAKVVPPSTGPAAEDGAKQPDMKD